MDAHYLMGKTRISHKDVHLDICAYIVYIFKDFGQITRFCNSASTCSRQANTKLIILSSFYFASSKALSYYLYPEQQDTRVYCQQMFSFHRVFKNFSNLTLTIFPFPPFPPLLSLSFFSHFVNNISMVVAFRASFYNQLVFQFARSLPRPDAIQEIRLLEMDRVMIRIKGNFRRFANNCSWLLQESRISTVNQRVNQAREKLFPSQK